MEETFRAVRRGWEHGCSYFAPGRNHGQLGALLNSGKMIRRIAPIISRIGLLRISLDSFHSPAGGGANGGVGGFFGDALQAGNHRLRGRSEGTQ